jgi:hypothetical protein
MFYSIDTPRTISIQNNMKNYPPDVKKYFTDNFLSAGWEINEHSIVKRKLSFEEWIAARV